MNPLVAVVIPCYNQAHFLSQSVGSVVGQTLGHWEMVIVNDGSTDDTEAEAQRLIARLPGRSIRLISQANAGVGAARNRGIAATQAPYVLALDADDMVAPMFLERTTRLLEEHADLGFVTTNVRLFGAEQGHWSGGDPTAERLIYDCRMVMASLFRREAWRQAGGFSEDRTLASYEDWDFWLRLVERGWRGQLLAERLAWYRHTAGGRFTEALGNDLLLRAELAQSHKTLYPSAFQPWAAGVVHAAARHKLTGLRWWRWYAAYASLIASHQPRELPKTLLRPFFAPLSPEQKMFARRFAQALRLSRKR